LKPKRSMLPTRSCVNDHPAKPCRSQEVTLAVVCEATASLATAEALFNTAIFNVPLTKCACGSRCRTAPFDAAAPHRPATKRSICPLIERLAARNRTRRDLRPGTTASNTSHGGDQELHATVRCAGSARSWTRCSAAQRAASVRYRTDDECRARYGVRCLGNRT
jgi:hypothetical protein